MVHAQQFDLVNCSPSNGILCVACKRSKARKPRKECGNKSLSGHFRLFVHVTCYLQHRQSTIWLQRPTHNDKTGKLIKMKAQSECVFGCGMWKSIIRHYTVHISANPFTCENSFRYCSIIIVRAASGSLRASGNKFGPALARAAVPKHSNRTKPVDWKMDSGKVSYR